MKSLGLIAMLPQIIFVYGLSAQNASTVNVKENTAPAVSNNPGYVSRFYINPGNNISPDYINGNLPNTPGYNPNYPYIPTTVPLIMDNSPRYNTYPGLFNNNPGIAPGESDTYMPGLLLNSPG